MNVVLLFLAVMVGVTPARADSLSIDKVESKKYIDVYLKLTSTNDLVSCILQDLPQNTKTNVDRDACVQVPCDQRNLLGRDATCLAPNLTKLTLLEKAEFDQSAMFRVVPPYVPVRLGENNDPNISFDQQFSDLDRYTTPSFVETRWMESTSGKSGKLDLAPVSQSLDVERALHRWRKISRDRPHSCDQIYCFNVYSININKTLNDAGIHELLTECLDINSNNILQAPMLCSPIYVSGARGDYILTIKKLLFIVRAHASGLRLGQFVFASKKIDEQKTEIGALANKIVKEALSGFPLSLHVIEDIGDLVGVATNRTSNIIPDWNEWVTIRSRYNVFPLALRVFEQNGERTDENEDLSRAIYINIADTIYLNNRNTTVSKDWRMPDAIQQEMYKKAIIGQFKKVALSTCKEREIVETADGFTMTCRSGEW